MDIVVDASVTLSWCFPDEQTALSLAVLDRLNAGDTGFANKQLPTTNESFVAVNPGVEILVCLVS
jgi:hypothetical protein